MDKESNLAGAGMAWHGEGPWPSLRPCGTWGHNYGISVASAPVPHNLIYLVINGACPGICA